MHWCITLVKLTSFFKRKSNFWKFSRMSQNPFIFERLCPKTVKSLGRRFFCVLSLIEWCASQLHPKNFWSGWKYTHQLCCIFAKTQSENFDHHLINHPSIIKNFSASRTLTKKNVIIIHKNYNFWVSGFWCSPWVWTLQSWTCVNGIFCFV